MLCVHNYKDKKMDIGKRVRYARKKIGLTQQQLSEKVELNQATIHRIESGQQKGTKSLLKLSRALNVSVGWLLNENEKNNGETQLNEGIEEIQSFDNDNKKRNEGIRLNFNKKMQLEIQLEMQQEYLDILQRRIAILESRLNSRV